jgi:hypothetical protein
MSEGLTKKEKGFADDYLETGNAQIACNNYYTKYSYHPSREILRKIDRKIKVISKDLYFIECKETGRIKIGISNNPHQRLIALQPTCSTKLELICIVPYGDRELEAHLHKKFAHIKSHYEWFNSDTELISMIKDFNEILCRQ